MNRHLSILLSIDPYVYKLHNTCYFFEVTYTTLKFIFSSSGKIPVGFEIIQLRKFGKQSSLSLLEIPGGKLLLGDW